MKDNHKNKPARNFLYAVLCILTSLAFVAFWSALLVSAVPYREEVFIVSFIIIVLSVFLGIIKPIYKLIKKGR